MCRAIAARIRRGRLSAGPGRWPRNLSTGPCTTGDIRRIIPSWLERLPPGRAPRPDAGRGRSWPWEAGGSARRSRPRSTTTSSMPAAAHAHGCASSPTAGGDNNSYLVKFYNAFSGGHCDPCHLALFNRTVDDARAFLLSQDVIYVGGGNTVNLLAVWRAQGMDVVLREAWERGIVLGGLCAGSMCWFEGGITASFGRRLTTLEDGLGLLPGQQLPALRDAPRDLPARDRGRPGARARRRGRRGAALRGAPARGGGGIARGPARLPGRACRAGGWSRRRCARWCWTPRPTRWPAPGAPRRRRSLPPALAAVP